MATTAIMSAVKMTSMTMLMSAKNEIPAVQQVTKMQTSVYTIVIDPIDTEAMLRVVKLRRAVNHPKAPVMIVAQQNART